MIRSRPLLSNPSCQRLITKQFFQLLSCGVFARVVFLFLRPVSSHEVKVFAKVPHMLVKNRLGPAIAALVRGPGVVTDAIKAYPEIRAALVAAFASTGLAGERPLPTALMTMSSHG
jgi:hypothetical protein